MILKVKNKYKLIVLPLPEKKRPDARHISSIIFENRRVNNRMDFTEIEKAQAIYNKLDKSGKTVFYYF